METKPLLDAVADLVTFASSPSFATTPAVIGQQVSVFGDRIMCSVCTQVPVLKDVCL